MKRSSLLVAVGVLLSAGVVFAAPLSFTVTSIKKRFDVERTQSSSTNFSNEKWGYTITIENKSFKNLQDLDVQYRQYKLEDVVKGEPKLKAFPGSTKIGALGNGQKYKFDTDPVSISKTELKANWSYTNGGKEKTKDNVAGYWLKIMQGSEVVYEIQYPPEFKGKMSW